MGMKIKNLIKNNRVLNQTENTTTHNNTIIYTISFTKILQFNCTHTIKYTRNQLCTYDINVSMRYISFFTFSNIYDPTVA